MATETPLPGLLDQVSAHTDVTYGDLAMIGAGLLSTVSAVSLYGWASPGSTLDYTKGLTTPQDRVVRDFVAWASHRKSLADGCDERLRAYVDESGWTAHLQHQVSEFLSGRLPESDRGSGAHG